MTKSFYMPKHFLSIIVRSRDEPFLTQFVDHYFHEGADHIYIVDDNLETQMPKCLVTNKQVTIFKAENWQDGDEYFQYSQMMDVNVLFEQIRYESEWFISVDADEYITTKERPENTIRDELLTTFKDADCVKVPWVMMASGGRQHDPKNILKELTYRWDHDKRHPAATWGKAQCKYDHIEVKCIFKEPNVAFISTHHPVLVQQATASVVDGVRGDPAPLDLYHPHLRNRDIESAYLLCYHYRVTSKEAAARKIVTHTKLRGEGGYAAYSADEIMAHDYAEVLDTTLQEKARRRAAG